MKNNDKTNVMRVLDSKKINYESHSYEADPTLTGEQIAGILGENTEKVFKTLVTQGKSGGYYVFVVPVEAELDLKKAAKAVGVKSVSMIKQKDLLPLTGYIHGGCSPIGMKKSFLTTFDKTCLNYDTILFSAGKIGYQVEVNVKDLESIIKLQIDNIIVGD